MRSYRSTALLICVLLTVGVASASADVSPDGIWRDAAGRGSSAQPELGLRAFRTVSIDWIQLGVFLDRTPREGTGSADVVLSLPRPDGGFERFSIVEAPVMAPELARKYPEIRTYLGRGLDDRTASVRFDSTPQGFHAMVLAAGGNYLIDPYSRATRDVYVVYWKRDAINLRPEAWRCDFDKVNPTAGGLRPGAPPLLEPLESGEELRTYRIAIAATGEYTQFHGGTVAAGLAAINTALNRVTGIYEREVAIRMQLVANNNLVVYTNPATDPYTNNNGVAMLGQNQTTLDAEIGNANYDIGHVFSTGGGGVASLEVPCKTGSKARGVTGLSSPTGDVFWVDFVAHEMGHQWGGNHSFNGTAGNCGGGRNGSTAYEPGSGSTIMAYAGICGSQNLQPNSDDYFHGVSFDEIVTYSTIGTGDTCAATAATGNMPPNTDAGMSYTIPLSTPFELCGSGSDPDLDPLTFGWEEFDLGPAGAPDAPVGQAPIFRSFDPVTSPCRTFPKLSDLLDNTQTIGELLPTYARTLNFRLTARDNEPGGGGVDNDSMVVTVSGTAGPFVITAPNTGVTWASGENRNIVWDVAGTHLSPVDCANVDILFSEDGGMTYPTTVEAAVPNDGLEQIVVPDADTTTARIKVACSDNVFFDITNADFTVLPPTNTAPVVTIHSPAASSTFDSTALIALFGSALDNQDGDISASIDWSSNLDGSLGTGAYLLTNLSVGVHTITAAVIDSGALPGNAVVGSVNVSTGVCSDHLVLTNQTISGGTTTFNARFTITAGESFVVDPGGKAIFEVGSGAALDEGAAIRVGGEFEVNVVGSPCP